MMREKIVEREIYGWKIRKRKKKKKKQTERET